MDNTEAKKFNEAWVHFETLLRGRLAEKMKNREVDQSYANVILDKTAVVWFSRVGAEGKWLADYAKKNPEKGEAVTQILRRELTFSDKVRKKNGKTYFKFGIPIAGGLAANAAARALGAGGAVSGAVSAVAFSALYPVSKSLSEDVDHNERNDMIDAYVFQLQPCRIKVAGIIQEG